MDRSFSNVKIKVTFSEAASTVVVSGGNNHAGNIDGSDTGQDLALGLGKIQNWYNNWHSVVWTGDAATVNGKTIAENVPSGAVFTDTTYTLSGAYGSNNDTWITTLTPSTGTATTSTVPKATTSVYGITTLSSATNSTDADKAATPAAVKSAYDLASGKSVVSFSQTLTSGAEVGEITINGTGVKLYAPAGSGNTTYTFAGGASGAYFTVTPSDTGTAQTVYIAGLGTMAFETAANYVPAKPDGTVDLINSSTHLINSEYLPSYVDDVIEGYYNPGDGKFYENRSGTSPSYTYSDEIPGESGKIYIDIGVTPAEPYRWGGSAFASMKSPTISAVANVVAGSTNGQLTVSYTDGTAASTVTAYEHPTSAGNKHIPSSGATGKGLVYGGSSGTASWGYLTDFYIESGVPFGVFTAATSGSVAGKQGIVPAPGTGTYTSGTNRHYLRSDATWSNDPVTTEDTLILNVVAGSS